MLEEEYNPRRQLPPRLRPAPPEEPAFSFEIRPATTRDIPDMLEIYNHYVANSTVTFDEDAYTLKEMRARFRHVVEELHYPWLVAVSPNGMILGYTYVTPWKQKAAYRFTVEDSIYLSPAATGKGIGKALLVDLARQCVANGWSRLQWSVLDWNTPSIAFYKSLGAELMDEWTICRVGGPALTALAQGAR